MRLGAKLGDSRDQMHRNRFFPFGAGDFVNPTYNVSASLEWFAKYNVFNNQLVIILLTIQYLNSYSNFVDRDSSVAVIQRLAFIMCRRQRCMSTTSSYTICLSLRTVEFNDNIRKINILLENNLKNQLNVKLVVSFESFSVRFWCAFIGLFVEVLQ